MSSEQVVNETDPQAQPIGDPASAIHEVVNEISRRRLRDSLREVQSLQQQCLSSNRQLLESLGDLPNRDAQTNGDPSFRRVVPTYDAVDETVRNVESGTVSTQTDPRQTTTGVETGVQAEAAPTLESSRNRVKRRAIPSKLPQNEEKPSRNLRFSPTVFNKKLIACPYTIRKNKYALSMMLVYMILTGFFSRLNHFNIELSNIPRCSIRNNILALNGITLLISVATVGVQLVFDSANIHNKGCFIFCLSTSTVQLLLHMLAFARIYFCNGSIFDYTFPFLTLQMALAYALVAAISQPRIFNP